ncbi:hypothetical protein [Halopelagius inordinatus]|uniref:hypothetical protein n=1 Tax=Halopelagius inordinatus TaxID=553467 RepID=UPI000B89BFF7|nr:hypothetical protein [Halopelagius inordinatus]
MSSFLILYGTEEGQTAKVAERVATTISERGHEASAIESITGENFTTVLIADSIAVWVVAIVLIVATRGQLGYDTSRRTARGQETH